MNERTKSRLVPKPLAPPSPNPSTVDNSEELAKKSQEFREALRKDDEREQQSSFHEDRDLWGRPGAGPNAPKTDPQSSPKSVGRRRSRRRGLGHTGSQLLEMADLSNPFTYKGHEVKIQTAERGGFWYWCYAIDTGQPVPMSEAGAVSAAVAYLEARHDAERHIDLMG